MWIDGLLIVDKPEGMTSLAVVKEIKRRFHVKKAGHIGTLDPFATGVLPVAINDGTKVVPFLEEEPKVYEGVLKLGEETTTDDLTGEVVSKKSWDHVTSELIHAVFHKFLGRIRQIPSMFSAIKVQGKPLYQLARKGIEVERKEREVEIFDIRVEEIDLPKVRFRVSCSKGTYIRTLGKDVGKQIGCGAYLLSLRRIRSGTFTLDRALPWVRLNGLTQSEKLSPWLISLKEALPGIPEVIGDERVVNKIRFGKEVLVRDLHQEALPTLEKGQWLKMTSPQQDLVAILRSEVGGSDIPQAHPESVIFRPLRVFHPPPPKG